MRSKPSAPAFFCGLATEKHRMEKTTNARNLINYHHQIRVANSEMRQACQII